MAVTATYYINKDFVQLNVYDIRYTMYGLESQLLDIQVRTNRISFGYSKGSSPTHQTTPQDK